MGRSRRVGAAGSSLAGGDGRGGARARGARGGDLEVHRATPTTPPSTFDLARATILMATCS